MNDGSRTGYHLRYRVHLLLLNHQLIPKESSIVMLGEQFQRLQELKPASDFQGIVCSLIKHSKRGGSALSIDFRCWVDGLLLLLVVTLPGIRAGGCQPCRELDAGLIY